MKRFAKLSIGAALSAVSAGAALAGSLVEPMVEPEVIMEEASSSTGMMIPIVLLLLIAMVLHHRVVIPE